MATSPSFATTPKFAQLVLNNANGGDTAYINPTTVATVLTVGSTGGRIDTVYLRPTGTNASCVVRFWVDNSGTGAGTTFNRLVQEVALAASTSSGVATLGGNVWSARMVLPASSVLRATVANTAVTNGVAIAVEYGEF
jgi:hypothetical protein